MLPISDFFAATYNTPVESTTVQATPVLERDPEASSELNVNVLKELILQMADNVPDKMDKINAILSRYGYETYDEDITNIWRALEINRVKANFSLNQFMVAQDSALQETIEEEDDDSGKLTVHTSYKDLWLVTANAIGSIKTDYVDFYAGLMQKYTEMYEHFNTYVQNASADAVTAGDDGNNVNFDSAKMQLGYDGFNAKVADIDLGSVKNWENMGEEQQQSMISTLKPAFNVEESSGKISFNLSQYDNANKFPAGINNGKVSTASYQAWLASFNATGTALQSSMQSFAQRYSQANSTFDNLNKVLSGMITSLANTAKDVLKSLN